MQKDITNYPLLINALKNSPFFKGLSVEVLEDILKIFHLEEWSKNQMFFHAEKTVSKFYFLVSGRVRMYQIDHKTGNEHILYMLSEGDVFDVICLLDEKEHKLEMDIIDDAVLLVAPIEQVRKWIAMHPEFNKTLLPYIANLLRDLEEKANDLALSDTWTRTLKLFIKHAKDNIHDSELKLINNLSHNEIAKIIGTSKNVISRHLQRLKEDKILKVSRKNIKVNDLKALINKLKEHKN